MLADTQSAVLPVVPYLDTLRALRSPFNLAGARVSAWRLVLRELFAQAALAGIEALGIVDQLAGRDRPGA